MSKSQIMENEIEFQDFSHNNEPQESLANKHRKKKQLKLSAQSPITSLPTHRRIVYTLLLLVVIVTGIIFVIVPFYKTYTKNIIRDDNQEKFSNEDIENGESNSLLRLRFAPMRHRAKSTRNLGQMNIYIRKPNSNSARQRNERFRFPVARYPGQGYPFSGPLMSFTPWLPIFVDRLSRQTIIFAPTGGYYILPPVISFYGKMYSVGELIASGYASLVSSGASLSGPINMMPYFQPLPLYGPGIPRISRSTGSFVGGVQMDYEFDIPEHHRSYIDRETSDETDEEDDYREETWRRPRPSKHSYSTKSSKCSLTFGKPVSYASADGVRFVHVANFNNDKNKDIAVLHYLGSTMDILLGKGDGTFEEPISLFFDPDYYPIAMATSDLNKDKNIDAVVAFFGGDKFGVYLGDGNGNFGSLKEYSTGRNSTPAGIVLYDVNRDNHLDVIVTCQYGDNVQIFLGKSDGSFYHHETYSTGENSGPITSRIGDFNKDGKIDFFVTHFHDSFISVFIGEGNGNFLEQVTYPAPFRQYGATVADFNYDGILDLGTNNDQINAISLYFGKGDGTFNPYKTYSTGNNTFPFDIQAADLNNDKILDIYVPLYGPDRLGVFLGNGDGTFKKIQTYSLGSESDPYGAVAGDFNNDGRLDVVTANNKTGDAIVLLNTCS